MSQPTAIPECVALHILRRMNRLSDEELARKARISRSLISRYQNAQAAPPDLLDGILEAMGFERASFEDLLSCLVRIETRRRMARRVATPVDPTPEEARDIEARAIAVGREAEQRTQERLTEAIRIQRSVKARAEAESICARLENDPKPWLAVEKVLEVQTWAVAERLAHRSAEVAPECVERARELAALACRVAELAPCEGPFVESLLGYTLTFKENTLRAAGEVPEAEALYVAAEKHWKAGAAAPGTLQEWRLLGLAGSLHRDQRRFAESLAHLEDSLATAPDGARGRLLVMKSLTLQQMGEGEEALRLLDEAEQAAGRAGDRRSVLIARFNRVRLLCILSRFGEAVLQLHELETIGEELGPGLIQIRLLWLRASVAAGLGHWDEAAARLEGAREAFTARKAAWECAWVSLELVVLLCRTGRTREIRELARGLAWIVDDTRLSLAARAALRLVCEAAEGPGVTLALAEQALQLLQRAPKGDAPEPSAPLVAGSHEGAMAPTVGVDDAAAFQGLDARRVLLLQEIAGRGPDADHPGDQLVHEAGGLRGDGSSSPQRGPGRREEDETGSETTPGGDASNHEKAPSRRGPGTSSPGRTGRPRLEDIGAENRFAVSPEIHPEDFRAFVRVLLALWDWSYEKLAAAAGLSPTTIFNYVTGKTRPSRVIVARLARGARVDLHIVDRLLLPAIVAWRVARDRTQDDGVTDIVQRLTAELQALVHLTLPLGPKREEQDRVDWPPAEVAREEARGLWKRLEDCEDAERWRLVETWSEYQHPGLAELLCHESAEAASDRADQALALAKLAHRVAELVLGDVAEKMRLLGYTGIALANAVRVAGELLPARERFDEGLASWKAGEGSATFLAEWRVLDFEASLLRDERQFEVALERLAKARDIAPAELIGRILLSQSAVHEQMGEGERAVEDLREAKRFVDRERDLRLFFGVRFNLAAALCLLNQFEEAEGMYPEIQDLAAGRELDTVRVKWLAGRIAAGLGRLDEAATALDEVRQVFTHQQTSPWDCSLVTLELATVHLRQGRTAEVRTLSKELMWVFEAQGIHLEALAALTLFLQAAKHEMATADFTDRLVRYLRKAQGDPDLRFFV